MRTNPYEGGSDHTVFVEAGVPSLLNWHFTDRYYHTNLDRPDKTSAAEMKNVGDRGRDNGAAPGVSRREQRAGDCEAGRHRRRHAAVARAAAVRERHCRRQPRPAWPSNARSSRAWQKWYVEALESVLRLPASAPDSDLASEVKRADRGRRRAPARLTARSGRFHLCIIAAAPMRPPVRRRLRRVHLLGVSFTIRRALKRGATVRIASLTTAATGAARCVASRS